MLYFYEGMSVATSVKHLAKLASDIWQIHPFCEGNTRATAFFMIKYMKTCGFRVKNYAFEKNSWYFRNALVRANYTNLQNGIHATTRFLEMFFSNLILETNYELKNRYIHVDYVDDQSLYQAERACFGNRKIPQHRKKNHGLTAEKTTDPQGEW